jgi:hypothetical protein
VTADELDEFMDLFADYFPDVSEWLRKQPGKTVTRWQEAFRDLDFDIAKRVLPSFLNGDRDWPSSWGKWPAEITRCCRATPKSTYRPPAYIDGHLTVECRECQDSGWRTCWHPVSVGAMVALIQGCSDDRPSFGAPMTRYTCAVRCFCKAGQRWREAAPVFDPNLWVLCDGVTHTPSVERLEKFVRYKLGVSE